MYTLNQQGWIKMTVKTFIMLQKNICVLYLSTKIWSSTAAFNIDNDTYIRIISIIITVIRFHNITVVNQIYTALVSIRGFFQKHYNNITNPKAINSLVYRGQGSMHKVWPLLLFSLSQVNILLVWSLRGNSCVMTG